MRSHRICVNRGQPHGAKAQQIQTVGKIEAGLGGIAVNPLGRVNIFGAPQIGTLCVDVSIGQHYQLDLVNQRRSAMNAFPRIHLSILKAMASKWHVVLEIAFYHSAITPFHTQSPFLSVLCPSQIHRRKLAVKRKQRRTVQCLPLQIAKQERCVQIEFDRQNELLRRGLAQLLALLTEQLIHLVLEILIQLLLVALLQTEEIFVLVLSVPFNVSNE